MPLKIQVLSETFNFIRSQKKFSPIKVPNRYQVFKIWDTPIENGLNIGLNLAFPPILLIFI